MRNPIKSFLILGLLITVTVGCEQGLISKKDQIVYKSVNKEYVLIRDVQALQASDDEISNHIDSILNGQINAEFISTGQKMFDLDTDGIHDIGFEIIDLNKYNPNGLPESYDSLAASVISESIEVLDNSTYGYCDALSLDDEISEDGNWNPGNCVLGTFMNGGKFQGQGEKYLGIRLKDNGDFKYGWVKLYCSQHSDTLRVIEYAYNEIIDGNIKAGQKK